MIDLFYEIFYFLINVKNYLVYFSTNKLSNSLSIILFFTLFTFFLLFLNNFFNLIKKNNNIILISSFIFFYIYAINNNLILINYIFYVFFLILHFFLIYNYKNDNKKNILFNISFLLPIVILILSKMAILPELVGISYMTFRMSYFVIELNNNNKKINILEYLSFLLFIPTLFIGPISPYSYFSKFNFDLNQIIKNLNPIFSRLIIGTIKFYFLSNIFNQFTFSSYWNDGYNHGYIDFMVSCISYYFYMYLNFSGFCDLVIGFSALLGIKVKENFNNPLAAKDLQDYWNRWHITLSEYMRDVMFTPLSKFILKLIGINKILIVAPISIFLTFLILGLWHGFYMGYFLFGIWHGFGLSIVLIWRNFSKKLFLITQPKLLFIKSFLFWLLTFIYVSLGFFFFENYSIEKMQQIINILIYD